MLRFLLDEHVSPRTAAGVRARRPACLILSLRDWHEGAYRQAQDEVILAAAVAEHLTLVTYDRRTVVPLLMNWTQLGQAHGGVILVDERTIAPSDIGGLVRALVGLWDREGAVEWENRVVYLRP